MDPTRKEDLVLGGILGFVALYSLLIALAQIRSRDRELISLFAGFGVFCGAFSLLLCTGWINVLPLPK